MISGLYLLASLNGAPLAPHDRAVLGVNDDACLWREPTFALRAADNTPAALSRVEDGPLRLVFLGYLDEPQDLAAILGQPPTSSPAALALAALGKWGFDAHPHLSGEWSLVCWHEDERALTIGVSATLRDAMLVASDGGRVAVAPDLRRLARLSWVGNEFDGEGFCLDVAGAPLRRRFLGDHTILRNVRHLEPDSFQRFTTERRTRSAAKPLDLPGTRWTGTFAEAADALEQTARRAMRQALARHKTVALMLRDGLENELLTRLAMEECGAATRLIVLARDADVPAARRLAQPFGLSVIRAEPPPDADPFRPSPLWLALHGAPELARRHYIYDAFREAAIAAGADAILDDAWGHLSLMRRTGLRGRFSWLSDWRRAERASLPYTDFLVQLAAPRLRDLPQAWRAATPLHRLRAEEGLGLAPDHRLAGYSLAAWPDLSCLMPYRDARLVRLMATMPARFTKPDGSIARTMMKAPGTARLHATFPPDHEKRLRRCANKALEHVSAWRQTGAGDWIDLEWLSRQLAALARADGLPPQDHFRTQATALAVQFFVWWQNNGQA